MSGVGVSEKPHVRRSLFFCPRLDHPRQDLAVVELRQLGKAWSFADDEAEDEDEDDEDAEPEDED